MRNKHITSKNNGKTKKKYEEELDHCCPWRHVIRMQEIFEMNEDGKAKENWEKNSVPECVAAAA